MLRELTPKIIDFIRNNKDLVDWYKICIKYKLTKEVYKEFDEYIDEYKNFITMYQTDLLPIFSIDDILQMEHDTLLGYKNYILKNNYFTNKEKEIVSNMIFHNSLEKEHDNINKIYLDMDGCIFHSCKAICDILNKRFNKNVKPESITKWNFSDGYTDLGLSDDYIENLFCCDEFFENVEMIDGAREFIEKYKDKIVLLTKGKWDNIDKKRKWLDKNGFKDITMIGIPLNVEKSIISMDEDDIFIDDSVKNLESQYYSGCALILFKEYDNETDWSKGWKEDYITSWK